MWLIYVSVSDSRLWWEIAFAVSSDCEFENVYIFIRSYIVFVDPEKCAYDVESLNVWSLFSRN